MNLNPGDFAWDPEDAVQDSVLAKTRDCLILSALKTWLFSRAHLGIRERCLFRSQVSEFITSHFSTSISSKQIRRHGQDERKEHNQVPGLATAFWSRTSTKDEQMRRKIQGSRSPRRSESVSKQKHFHQIPKPKSQK